MDKTSKRSRHGLYANDVGTVGLGETWTRVKRPKHAQNAMSAMSSAASTTSRDSLESANSSPKHLPADLDNVDGGEWTTMVSRKKRKIETKEQKSTYPEIVFHTKQQVPIRIQDLQNLALYTLADGIGPSWLAFSNVRETRKVVVLMVPGLEMEMFDRSRKFEDVEANGNGHVPDEKIDRRQNADSLGLERTPKSPAIRQQADFEAWRSRKPIERQKTSFYTGVPTALDPEKLPASFGPLTSVFSHVWPVRSPGDARNSKVHSPLQAMLVSSIPAPQENKGLKGVRPPAEEKLYKPVRTHITAFIHSADELRDANYPVHPASFTSAADARLELQRRKATSQSSQGGWVDTKVTCCTPALPPTPAPASDLTCGLTIYSVDCEMVITTDEESSLVRISVLEYPSNKIVLNKFVKPALPIKNYLTQISGVTPELLEPVTSTLLDIQSELLELFTPSSILLGHSLESDLKALKLTHPFIIDTALIYPHPRGLPLRSSLKYLAAKYLRRDIQTSDSGHDSIEDARAVLDLVKLKCEKGPKWGTSEAHGESLFCRLSRAKGRDGNTRTSAMVDFGTPERGYGKEADVKIACASDDEIVVGVLRAVHGDPDGKEIRAGGVDFLWGRLRALELARGWGKESQVEDNYSTQMNRDTKFAENGSQPAYLSALEHTISNLHQIHAALPPCTLLIVYSGTGDPRPLVRLQKQHAQFRKEFKVKKWDDLSVRWTDDDEQALKAAAEKARNGVGFVCVK